MPRKTPRTALLLAYGLAAVLVTWPLVLDPFGSLPGAERSDLWNSLWSFWYLQHSVLEGSTPFATELLGFPAGGSLAVADPLNAVLGLALVPAVGLVAAYNLIVLGHLVFAGWAAHRLAEEITEGDEPGWSAWVAGLGFLAAPVLVSAVHNGTSEAIAAGWLPLALLAGVRALRRPSAGAGALAAVALAAALWASWYLGLCAILGLAALAAVGEGTARLRRRLTVLLPVLLVGALLALPLAWAQHHGSTAADNLVGIKGAAELALVRRMTGAADPLGFFMPGEFRSPDFARMSRYGEDFVHCAYLGWLAIIGTALAALRRRAGTAWLLVAAALGLVLAMGPVLVRDGQALLLPGDRAVPLPYLLLEGLPGFSGLSLLFRLAMLPSLALVVCAARGISGLGGTRARVVSVVAAVAVFAELRAVAPTHDLPALSDAAVAPALETLAEAPEAGVMNFPVVGGRRYLYEQTLHGKPITGGLNFPNNGASMRVWSAIIDTPTGDDAAYRAEVQRAACAEGVGYLVVHIDALARPDRHDLGVRAAHHRLPVIASSPGVRVHELCPSGAENPPLDSGSSAPSG